MAARRHGFALIIVLIVVGAVFALAIQGGIAMRSATIETGALRDLAAIERDARSAAYIALVGLTTPVGSEPDQYSIGGDSAPEAPAATPTAAPDDEDIPELPPIVKDLLNGMLDEEQKKEQADEPSTAPRTGRSAATPGHLSFACCSR